MSIVRAPTDNRMLWILYLERVKAAPERTYRETCEIVSETQISRRLHYEDGMIAFHCLGPNNYLDGLFSYELQLTLPLAEEIERNEKDEPIFYAARDGYNSRGNFDELISLLSLHLNTRFFPVQWRTGEHTATSISSQWGRKFVHLPCLNARQKKSDVFTAKNKDLWPAADFLNEVRKLRPELHQQFYYAARSYAEGLRLIGFEDEIAYIHFVSAVSALASTNSGKDRVEFRSFLLTHGSDFLSTQKPGSPTGWITKENAELYLNTIYTARSEYLHAGVPMWISEEQNTFDEVGRGYDLDLALGRIEDRREWGEHDRVPTVLFFEALVRHCLREYLRRNVDPTAAAALPEAKKQE